MPKTWITALNKYNYQVDLTRYSNAAQFPNFFNRQIQGDRNFTKLFEDYFRVNMQSIEVWYEVIFWKMYSQPNVRNQNTTERISQMNKHAITASQLTNALKTFTNNPSRQNFRDFRKLFHFNISFRGIATAATFPAFVDPIRFPMVDRRIAKWVNSQLNIHNANDPLGPQLIRSRYGQNTSNVLTMADFNFYLCWIRWTRHMANKLSKLTDEQWRARDVEMAVFTAWGDSCPHPHLPLNPI